MHLALCQRFLASAVKYFYDCPSYLRSVRCGLHSTETKKKSILRQGEQRFIHVSQCTAAPSQLRIADNLSAAANLIRFLISD